MTEAEHGSVPDSTFLALGVVGLLFFPGQRYFLSAVFPSPPVSALLFVREGVPGQMSLTSVVSLKTEVIFRVSTNESVAAMKLCISQNTTTEERGKSEWL